MIVDIDYNYYRDGYTEAKGVFIKNHRKVKEERA